MHTTRPIVQRFLLTVTMVVCAACDRFQPAQRMGAPDGSYTPMRLTILIDGAPEVVEGAVVTPQFFTTGGVKPLLGRFFVESDYASGGAGVAVLSHRYWVKRFRSTPNVIGSGVEIERQRRVIVGVGPPQFQPDRGGSLWIPKRD